VELSDDILVLQNLVRTLLLKIEEQVKEIALLKAENVELRNRLNQNSSNSSLPPSTDKFKAKPAFVKVSKGKPGGQLGHHGKTLSISSNPDIIEKLLPSNICNCGCDITNIEPVFKERRQVYDLPAAKLIVTEYQQYVRQCPCCQAKIAGAFPSSVNNHVQYGNGVMALCSLLSSGFHLSIQNISQLFTDLYNQPLNTATVLTANTRTYDSLQNSESLIKEQLMASKVVHFDETGLACEGKTHWLHVACNALWTYFFVHTNRGAKALEADDSLIKDFKNWSIHDCWSSYFPFESCTHAVCNAHILRELQALIEQGSQWAKLMHQLLLKMYQLSAKATSHIENLSPHLQEYDRICKVADSEEPPSIKPPKGRPKSTKGRNLFNRLVLHKESVVAFAKYDFIPFTNNQAERDIRPAKGKIKVAGCFRTQLGAKHYARIQGFISSARKQGQSVFNQLKMSLQGNNFIIQSATN
jgi:transposase